MKRLADACVRRHRQRGVFVLAGALMLVPIIAFFGLALDVTFAYARRAEMQDVADAAALAAARALNGTPAGVQAARDAAAETAALYKYSWGSAQVTWNDAALTLSDDPDAAGAAWLPIASVTATDAGRMSFARVDTRELLSEDGVALGSVTLMVMQKFIDQTTIMAGGAAVAGPTATRILPLAICAMDNAPASSRSVRGSGDEELVEYGFRRGVGYNLLDLNPTSPVPANYVINPLDFPNAPEIALHKATETVSKFICDGSIAAPRLRNGSQVYVSAPFPSELADELNSRFDRYPGGKCNDKVAVPDANVRQFTYSTGYVRWWMNSKPSRPSSESTTEAGRRISVVDMNMDKNGDGDIDDVGEKPSAVRYGTLWAYSRPVRRDPAAPGEAGVPFEPEDWKDLYPAFPELEMNTTKAGAIAPYAGSTHFVGAAFPRMARRRVLHVPLLQCTGAIGSTATVLGVGRFLMTAEASSTLPAIHAEFGGLASEAELGTSIGLYR